MKLISFVGIMIFVYAAIAVVLSEYQYLFPCTCELFTLKLIGNEMNGAYKMYTPKLKSLFRFCILNDLNTKVDNVALGKIQIVGLKIELLQQISVFIAK